LAASRAGLDSATIDALEVHQKPLCDNPIEEIVYSVSRELLETTGLSDATFLRAHDALGLERLIELVAIVGYGCLLSLAINTFEPDPLPDDDRSLVPGGPPPTTYTRTTGGPRLSPLQDATLSDTQRRIATQLEMGIPGSVKGAYATWLRTPKIAERVFRYEQVLHGHLLVPHPFVELVVLVTARFWTADELWAVHRDRALDVGLSADLIAAIAEHRMPNFASKDEATVHAFADGLLTQGRVNDDTFAQSVAQCGYQTVIELVAVAGFYSMVALTLNAFEVMPAHGLTTLPRFPTS
jgi:4-carboxymuconolactone decarboxylase